MKLDDVIARVRAQVDTGMLIADARTEETVRATIAALGLEVARDGEVYNPAAPAARAPSLVPEDNWRRSVRPRGRR